MTALLDADAWLLDWILSWPRPAPLVWLFVAVTLIGKRSAVWLVLAVFRGWRCPAAWPAVLRLALALALCSVVVDSVLKPLVDRPRPDRADAVLVDLEQVPTSRSLPSGHAASAVCGAYALSLAWPRRRRLFWTLAALIALSRVYLGVHYPLDVVAGALVGYGVARFATAGVACYIGGPAWRSPAVPR